MNRAIIKSLIICSLILGLILGILSVIPYLGVISFLALMLFSAPLVMLYLIMDGKLDLTNIQNSIIQGAITGFFANIMFCSVFAILSVLILVGFNYSVNLILVSMIKNSALWLFVLMVLFISVLTAVTNAFTGFITYYIINVIRDIYEKKHK